MRTLFMLWLSWYVVAAAHASPFSPVSYGALNGWSSQSHEQALAAFHASCIASTKPQGSHAAHFPKALWKETCAAAAKLMPATPAKREQARHFFEQHFTPHRINTEEKGKITGYYIPLLEGALTQGGDYQWPVYGVPKDFKSPYLTRSEIEAGALAGKGLELVWLNDPVMRYFLHVQGSGHVRLPDGKIVTLQFAAKNGQPYTAIGKILIAEGHLTKQNVSLQTIRDYLYAHPKRQQSVMNANDSYVFFRLSHDASMPKGAQGVPLTPEHSIAIDPAYWPYGIPIFLDAKGKSPFQRLTITQDTGSAIKGEVRGDWFAGLGKKAEALAGHLVAPTDWFVLLPTAP